MLLHNFFYIENFKQNIIYSEKNKLFVSSSLNNSIYTINNSYSLFLSDNLCNIYTNDYFNNNCIYTINSLRLFLKNNLFGSSIRFRMIGRGYYLYNKKNILYFRLGFSHVIKYILPLNTHLKKKKKKKNFWVLGGTNLYDLVKISNSIRGLRGPNLYSKRIKGISLYNEFIPRGINSYSKF